MSCNVTVQLEVIVFSQYVTKPFTYLVKLIQNQPFTGVSQNVCSEKND